MAASSSTRPAPLRPRAAALPFASLLLPLLSILIAMGAGALIMAASGFAPIAAYAVLFRGAFGSTVQFAETLKSTTPLLLAGLGVAIAFRAGAFNIGAVGQMYVGALAAVIVGGQLPGTPAWLHVALATLSALLAGGLWAGIAGVLKTRYGANEVITTILLNYIGIYLVDYMIGGPIQAPGHHDAPTSWPLQPSAVYPKLIPRTQLHAGFILALLAMVAVYVAMRYTTFGYRVRMVGLNREAARHAGVRVDRVFLTAFFLSGALAGLAGGAEILGYRNRLITGFAPSTGYDAIAVALLGELHPFGVGLAAMFFAALRNGATAMEAIARLPAQLADIIRVLAILAVLAASSPAILKLARRADEPLAGDEPAIDGAAAIET